MSGTLIEATRPGVAAPVAAAPSQFRGGARPGGGATAAPAAAPPPIAAASVSNGASGNHDKGKLESGRAQIDAIPKKPAVLPPPRGSNAAHALDLAAQQAQPAILDDPFLFKQLQTASVPTGSSLPARRKMLARLVERLLQDEGAYAQKSERHAAWGGSFLARLRGALPTCSWDSEQAAQLRQVTQELRELAVRRAAGLELLGGVDKELRDIDDQMRDRGSQRKELGGGGAGAGGRGRAFAGARGGGDDGTNRVPLLRSLCRGVGASSEEEEAEVDDIVTVETPGNEEAAKRLGQGMRLVEAPHLLAEREAELQELRRELVDLRRESHAPGGTRALRNIEARPRKAEEHDVLDREGEKQRRQRMLRVYLSRFEEGVAAAAKLAFTTWKDFSHFRKVRGRQLARSAAALTKGTARGLVGFIASTWRSWAQNQKMERLARRDKATGRYAAKFLNAAASAQAQAMFSAWCWEVQHKRHEEMLAAALDAKRADEAADRKPQQAVAPGPPKGQSKPCCALM